MRTHRQWEAEPSLGTVPIEVSCRGIKGSPGIRSLGGRGNLALLGKPFTQIHSVSVWLFVSSLLLLVIYGAIHLILHIYRK